MPRYFLHGGAYHVLPEGGALPAGAVETPRLPGNGEAWNAAAGRFDLNEEVQADLEVSREHIETVHLLKTVEAAVILSGVMLSHGLLAEEAEATGIPILTLAGMVAAKGEEMRARERVRREKKVRSRNQR